MMKDNYTADEARAMFQTPTREQVVEWCVQASRATVDIIETEESLPIVDGQLRTIAERIVPRAQPKQLNTIPEEINILVRKRIFELRTQALSCRQIKFVRDEELCTQEADKLETALADLEAAFAQLMALKAPQPDASGVAFLRDLEFHECEQLCAFRDDPAHQTMKEFTAKVNAYLRQCYRAPTPPARAFVPSEMVKRMAVQAYASGYSDRTATAPKYANATVCAEEIAKTTPAFDLLSDEVIADLWQLFRDSGPTTHGSLRTIVARVLEMVNAQPARLTDRECIAVFDAVHAHVTGKLAGLYTQSKAAVVRAALGGGGE